MTQRIFKKSNKQDMVDLFNILSDNINYIFIIEDSYFNKEIYFSDKRKEEQDDLFDTVCEDLKWFDNILKIDFETDNIKEMIIERPKGE